MIYDGEVSFVLSMQNRCILFVALYFPDLLLGSSVLSFIFNYAAILPMESCKSLIIDSYFCPSRSGRRFGFHKQEYSLSFLGWETGSN